MNKMIDENDHVVQLNLPRRITNILRKNGIKTITDLAYLYNNRGRRLVKEIRGLGPISFLQIGQALLERGKIDQQATLEDEIIVSGKEYLVIDIGNGYIEIRSGKDKITITREGQVWIESQNPFTIKPTQKDIKGNMGEMRFYAQNIRKYTVVRKKS